jgi:hypothetical protein
MEKTMYEHFCMGQNLRVLFSEHEIPESVHPLIVEYERRYGRDIRGTFRNDNLAFDESFMALKENVTWSDRDLSDLSDLHYLLLQRWISAHGIASPYTVRPSAFVQSKVKFLGRTLQTYKASRRDSYIMFRTSPSSSTAGCIQDIFSHTRKMPDGSSVTKTFFIVQEFCSLTPEHAARDVYRDFPIVAGQLFYNRLVDEPTIVTAEEIVCQFACTEEDSIFGIPEPCLHVLPLDKVFSLMQYKCSHHSLTN